MKERCEDFLGLLVDSSVILYVHAIFTYITSLASFKIYRKTKDLMWLNRGKKLKQDMQRWAEQGSSWNFQHCHLLITAEESYSDGNLIFAKENYKSAITVAREHKFINDAALVRSYNELYFTFRGLCGSCLSYSLFLALLGSTATRLMNWLEGSTLRLEI